MSKITGVEDFKDIIDKYGIEFIQKLKIYIGYYNYIENNPLNTEKLKEYKDWAFLWHYAVMVESVYKLLKTGSIILYTRDYFSLQEDATGWRGCNQSIKKLRNKYFDELIKLGYSRKEAKKMSKYRFELEDTL